MFEGANVNGFLFPTKKSFQFSVFSFQFRATASKSQKSEGFIRG